MSIRYDGEVSVSVSILAENVRRIRTERGLTQEQLGRRLGDWPQSRISELESGKFDRVLSAVDEVARALHVQPWKLIQPATCNTEVR